MTLGGGLSGGGSTISVFGAGVLSKLTDSATTILDEAEAMFKESPLPPPLPPPSLPPVLIVPPPAPNGRIGHGPSPRALWCGRGLAIALVQ